MIAAATPAPLRLVLSPSWDEAFVWDERIPRLGRCKPDHDWRPSPYRVGGSVIYVCANCGAEEERDRS